MVGSTERFRDVNKSRQTDMYRVFTIFTLFTIIYIILVYILILLWLGAILFLEFLVELNQLTSIWFHTLGASISLAESTRHQCPYWLFKGRFPTWPPFFFFSVSLPPIPVWEVLGGGGEWTPSHK